MNRAILQKIAGVRRREARALLTAGLYEGAYYLVGYAVECALKACVAKQVHRHDFPDKRLAMQVYTHNLEVLVKAAGLWPDLQKDIRANPALGLNWTVVKDWSEVTRYQVGTTAAEAKDLYSACTARKNGILTWIKKRW